MNPRHHLDPATLVSHAAGALSPEMAAVADTHLEVCAHCRRQLADAEHVGGVLLSQSLGYELRTDSLTLDLDQTGAETAGQIEGFGPLGRLTAGKMVLSQPDPAQSTYLLVFNGGVRLIYQP